MDAEQPTHRALSDVLDYYRAHFAHIEAIEDHARAQAAVEFGCGEPEWVIRAAKARDAAGRAERIAFREYVEREVERVLVAREAKKP